MKKSVVLILAVILLATGGYLYLSRSADQPGKSGQGESILKDSLAGRLKGGGSVECVMASPDGTMTVRAKDGKVRIDGLPYAFGAFGDEPVEPAPGVSLTTEDWVYMWSGNEGTKFNVKELEKLSTSEERETAMDYSWEKWTEGMEAEGVDYSCSEKRLDDGLFVPPNDVTFADWTEFFTQMGELGRQLEGATGTEGEIDFVELQRQMEEFDLSELMAGLEAE